MLSGNIPSNLANLTFLSILNLSYFNLSRLVPQVKQFATFEASSYLGNPNLHGWPLENGTLRSRPDETEGQVQWNSTGLVDRDADADEIDQWWAISVGLCFGVGFDSVIAVLCIHPTRRYKFFALLDSAIQYLFEH
ncbi:hypothetical protein SUGI_0874060 [Cryptomeria japonica]|nr:hypothetical protein SUGI_0874060 [Cryptomeria japonica]